MPGSTGAQEEDSATQEVGAGSEQAATTGHSGSDEDVIAELSQEFTVEGGWQIEIAARLLPAQTYEGVEALPEPCRRHRPAAESTGEWAYTVVPVSFELVDENEVPFPEKLWFSVEPDIGTCSEDEGQVSDRNSNVYGQDMIAVDTEHPATTAWLVQSGQITPDTPEGEAVDKTLFSVQFEGDDEGTVDCDTVAHSECVLTYPENE
ncbi:hypothetical protein [Ornithinicoccus hortensis]|uniref:Uncharacterized protein n=1 Tax=Ornithinicoccus hortensis TaxID=82346 RepID=A0A542YUP1_9MICO|nr:hypothetical protein [Ornithinicoccus hortensis]TQL51799.1 hypothetical protein FB467_2962 [Ornithinicoccus hortensis]